MKNSFLYTLSLVFLISSLNGDTLSISKAYELSLDNSNEMKSSAYQLEASKENINQVKSKLYPQISANVTHSRTDFEVNHMQSRADYEIVETSTDYTVALNQTLYNQEIYSKIGIERTRLKLSKIKLELQKQELSTRVLKTYLDILKSKTKIDLYDSFAKYNKYKSTSIEKKYKMNLSNKMDLLQAKVDYNTSKVNLAKEKKLFNIYNLKLQQLIGTEKFSLPNVDFKTIDLQTIELMKKSVKIDENFDSNLNMQQAKLGIKLTKQEIKNAQNGHYPTLSLNARYTKYDSDDISTDYESMNKVSLQLEVPIYNGGYVNSKVASSRLTAKAAQEDLELTKKNVQIQYDELLAIFNSSVDSLNLYQESLDSAHLYIDSVSLGFQNGLKSIIDLNDAKNKLHDLKYKYMENMYEMLNSYVELLIINNKLEDLKLIDTIIKKD